MGSRDLSLSKSVGRSVPIPHTPHIPCSKVSSQGIKAQDLLSAQSHLVGQDRQPWHQFQHNQSLANLARDAKDHGDCRDLAPLCRAPPCSQQDQGLEKGAGDHPWRLLVTQSLSGKKPLCFNEFQWRPSQNPEASIPQAVLLIGEGLLCSCTLPIVGWEA